MTNILSGGIKMRTGQLVISRLVEDILSDPDRQSVEITPGILRNFIRKHAGMDDRTVKKYFKLLFDLKYCEWSGNNVLVSR